MSACEQKPFIFNAVDKKPLHNIYQNACSKNIPFEYDHLMKLYKKLNYQEMPYDLTFGRSWHVYVFLYIRSLFDDLLYFEKQYIRLKQTMIYCFAPCQCTQKLVHSINLQQINTENDVKCYCQCFCI